MAQDIYWADSYVEKQCSAADAIKKIRQGQRVFIGSACGEPQELVRCLAENAIHKTLIVGVQEALHFSVGNAKDP